jgi:hypothetical protein
MAIHMHLQPYYQVRLRLIDKQSERPVHGEGFTVLLYDKDIGADDFLGEATPDESGYVSFRFHRGQFQSSALLPERHPDLYFKVLRDGEEIFRSPVAHDMDPKKSGDFDPELGFVLDLGAWQIEGRRIRF